MNDWKEDVKQLQKWRENNDRKSNEIICIWLYKLHDNIDKLGNEKYLILEQVSIAALDCHVLSVAKECIEILAKKFPRSLRVKRLESMYFECNGNYDIALNILNAIIKEDDINSSARKRKVAVYKAQGNNVEAIKELTEYLKIFMTDAEAWQELSELYIEENDFHKAAFCVEELILQNPHNHLLHQRYADIKYTQGGLENFELAKLYYMQSLNMCSKNIRSLYGLYLASSALSTSSKNSSQKKKDALKLVEWSLKELKNKYNEVDDYDLVNMLSALEI